MGVHSYFVSGQHSFQKIKAVAVPDLFSCFVIAVSPQNRALRFALDFQSKHYLFALHSSASISVKEALDLFL